MRHLFIAQSDYASSGNAFCLALKSVGEEGICLISKKHLYQYPEQGEVVTQERSQRLEEAVDWAQWIWVIQTDVPCLMGGTFKAGQTSARDAWFQKFKDCDKKIVLLHGGFPYRENRDFYSELWKDLNPISICFEADLMGGFEREHLILPPVNLAHMPYIEREKGAMRVGHFPSRPTDKGSEWIVPKMKERLNGHFFTSVTNPFKEDGCERVTWDSQLKRIRACDVVIDQIKPELNGYKFGEWVSCATETAALGRIPIANSLDPNPYVETYGRMPGIHICNDDVALAVEIDRLAGLSESRLLEEQEEAREWILDCHTLEATGNLLRKVVLQ